MQSIITQDIVTGDKPLVVTLMGPTACGKTALAMALNNLLPLDIISVDSALVYRNMNIGTAKPTAAELIEAPHALIDIRDPADSYNVADFCCDAQKAIADSIAKHRIPLLVGGTMMYFKAWLEGLAILPAADTKVRTAIASEAAERGWPALHKKLLNIDPDYARTIHPNHSQRISRGLEVYYTGGRTMSSYRQQQQIAPKEPLPNECYQIIQLAVLPGDRSALHQRIQQRFDGMLKQGFVGEVEALFQRQDLTAESPSMRTVGYRQIWKYLEGDHNYDVMREKAIVATRQLAKRQLTWLRRWPNIHSIIMELFTDDETQNDRQVTKIADQIMQALPLKGL